MKNKMILATPGSYVTYYHAPSNETKREPVIAWMHEMNEFWGEEMISPVVFRYGGALKLQLEDADGPGEDETHHSFIVAYEIPGWGVIDIDPDSESCESAAPGYAPFLSEAHLECPEWINDKARELQEHRKARRKERAEIRSARALTKKQRAQQST